MASCIPYGRLTSEFMTASACSSSKFLKISPCSTFPKLRNLGEFVFDRVIVMVKGRRKKAEEEEDSE